MFSWTVVELNVSEKLGHSNITVVTVYANGKSKPRHVFFIGVINGTVGPLLLYNVRPLPTYSTHINVFSEARQKAKKEERERDTHEKFGNMARKKLESNAELDGCYMKCQFKQNKTENNERKIY